MKYHILIIFTLLSSGLFGQEMGRGDIRMVFYNVENYFDIFDDTLTLDNEFLPASEKNWIRYRFDMKKQKLFQVMAAIGENEAPEIIALAEVENRYVLSQLVNQTPLAKYNYQIVHFDSPDIRGIDVALLFRTDKLGVIYSENIPIRFPNNTRKRTRDILYTCLKTNGGDTLHTYVNHWPSRRGGKAKSEPNRMYVATVLKQHIDSIRHRYHEPYIIITGDFNDEPMDNSLIDGLNVQNTTSTVSAQSLHNLMAPLQDSCDCGSYRYRAHWNMLDQFIVSGSLLDESSSLHTCPNCVYLGQYDFLLQDDTKYGGKKPKRTYLGPRYQGGFSDHLPIYLDLYYEE